MQRSDPRYRAYLSILNAELVPATGCTEPISIAYASAVSRETLGALPAQMRLVISSNIIKNAKSVVVPNTGGLKGLEAAAAAGAAVGKAWRGLDVISGVTPGQQAEIRTFLHRCPIEVAPAQGDEVFDILVEAQSGADTARVRITGCHTNIALVEKNGKVLHQSAAAAPENSLESAYALLCVEDIYDFACTCAIEDVREALDRQIAYNGAIRDAGLRGNWGANIGRTLLRAYGNHVSVRARAAAAAGSDARMSGCELPVIINSGSGNQGMTASLPVMEYAQELDCTHEQLCRALTLSNLLTIHLKTGIGRLSAYCGAVSAGCAAGAAIAYLHGGNAKDISHTLVNAVAITSGIVCDGAKPSCAAKIACAVDAGILGWQMFIGGQQFYSGDGIVTKGVEATIANVSRLGRVGMREADREIMRIMCGQE